MEEGEGGCKGVGRRGREEGMLEGISQRRDREKKNRGVGGSDGEETG